MFTVHEVSIPLVLVVLVLVLVVLVLVLVVLVLVLVVLELDLCPAEVLWKRELFASSRPLVVFFTL